MIGTLRIYSLDNFDIRHTTVSITLNMYIISLVLTYHITGSLYLLTPFSQFPFSSPLASGNHKSDLFLSEFVSFVFEV